MSVNGASNGKAPAQEPQQSHRPERGLVKVQPARLDDLQPRYASKIQHEQENSEAHGWYARLSKCFGPGNQTRPRANHRVACLQSTVWASASVSAELSLAASAARTLTSPSDRVKWAWSRDSDGSCIPDPPGA